MKASNKDREGNDEIIDIQAAILNKNTMPIRHLEIGKQTFECLCDTGACTTVLTSKPPGYKEGTESAWIRTASGHVVKNYFSEPIKVTDLETGQTKALRILVDSSCPINLLGRDCMTAFSLAIVPAGDKMRCVPVTGEFPVLESREPHYFWTLDVETGGAVQILKLLPDRNTSNLEVQTADKVHCTLRYKHTPGPDEAYSEKVMRLRNQGLKAHCVYENPQGEAAAAVWLTPEQQQLYRNSGPPHISLRKLRSTEWSQMSDLVHGASRGTYPTVPVGQWAEDKTTGYRRYVLDWTLRAHSAIHLD